MFAECCEYCKKKSKGKLLLKAFCWDFCSMGSVSIVKNKLLVVPYLASTSAVCIHVLMISYLLLPDKRGV